MIIAIPDTHAITWYLSNNPKLSANARQFIRQAIQNGDEIGVSSITFVELVYLIEKGKIPAQQFTQLADELNSFDSMFLEVPVDLKIARALSRLDVTQIPDMPDRIIAATAWQLKVPVISRDNKIQLSSLTTIW
jgi:PIN domain nuclease of toxin-antitoxin system